MKALSHSSPIKVAPAELENLILTHPAIADTCVVGVPDQGAGELPKAYCVKKKGHENVTTDEIVQYIAGNLLQTVRSYYNNATIVIKRFGIRISKCVETRSFHYTHIASLNG